MDADRIIAMLDSMDVRGISRMKINVEENRQENGQENGQTQAEVDFKYHHGRCDVGSPFATGSICEIDLPLAP